ncbi:hypothetical protein A1O1_03561 [Capronia coronata CBS 617.96]|uniref:U4/U6.U5 small nuclear ribonucleoprotein 27kDa protein domain-containing protein n=1 Tax=Capronia coronata CBS 617.96 TaxID=1182541 RepID=W9Z7H9_9EURO|nr:uncharacterized protein A1O1_03561 [Capronia coronata CBS 617.96]EXJ90459.1 hypothetical protein A1O1_03561 [Capronia coronata CBS 617.96]
MDEPPMKRPRRADSAAMWDKDEKPDPRLSSSGRDKPRAQYGEDREGGRLSRHDDGRRKRSRSRDNHERRNERDRDRERGPRDRDANGGIRRDRSRSRNRQRAPRGTWESARDKVMDSRGTDSRNERSNRRSRSRSPYKNGGNTSVRTRSPPRRADHNRPRSRERTGLGGDSAQPKPRAEAADKETPDVNGDRMAVDEEDEEALLRKLMGFTTFKTTQNTKVPGNQIYGVRREKKIEYRQYMNRVGGFNRPLSPSR